MSANSFYFEDILNSMADPVRVIDASGTVVYQNMAMTEIAGDMIGRKCYEVFCGQHQCERCICKNQANGCDEIEKQVSIGERRYSVKAARIQDEPRKMVEVYRDITEALENRALLEAQHAKNQADLEFARKIQKCILPTDGEYGELVQVSSLYEPAELLGGDIFDIIPIDEDHFGVYIADVSGHGVTSSMITLFVRQAIKGSPDVLKDPCKTLSALYTKYEELGISDDKYITVLYGVYDMRRQLMRFSNAGHNCMPIHIDDNGQVREINTKGMPICTFFEDIACSEVVIPMTAGHRLLLYTDGISEARDDAGTLYGDRILCLVDQFKRAPLIDLCEAIDKDRRHYAGDKKEDDLALLALEILK